MANRFYTLLLFLFLGCVSFAQNNETTSSDSSSLNNAPPAPKPKKEFIFKPTIGLGTGMFSFYGDIYNKHFQAPMVSRIGYELNVSQYLTDYLQMNFYVLFGRLGANERFTENNRNLNFESQIRVGGLNVLYNFGNFLPKDRTASPYISLGIESFEFLSKTDLFDANGKRYYYWTDGTTRDIDENASTASSAVLLQRDYTYESDVREQNLDGFGKYPERSFAVPVGVGVIMKINDHWNFKLGATMHFSFTDYIDGVSNKSVGNRVGNAKNDNFMMTSFSLHYDLGSNKNDDDDENAFSDIDFFALDLQDSDKDGVSDATDSCQGTLEGVPVDAKGCPLDDDNDGVPNYKDDELNSPKDAFVDLKGVQLTDSIIAYQYAVYMDSTGAFAKVEYHDHNGNNTGNNYSQKEYAVELGTFKKGLPPELMTKFLSIGDISSTNIDDSTTIYTSGKFNNYLDAEKRKKQLVAEGIKDAKVVYKQNGKYVDAPVITSNVNNNSNSNANNSNNNNNANNNSNANNNADSTANNTNANTNNNSNTNNNTNVTGNNNTNSNNNSSTSNNTNATSNNSTTSNNTNNSAINKQGVVLRIQLGAYHKKLSKNVFKDVGDLIEIQTEDGLYKYMTGSFTTFEAAAKHKVEMFLKGYQGAFITAYKDGKRVSLKEAGATPAKKEDQLDDPDDKAVNAVDKKLVIFKVQVGVFKNEPPSDKQAIYDKMKNVIKESTGSGLSRYVVGSYNDYASAQAAKNKVSKNYGLEDAFIVAFYNNAYISIQEALELLK